MISRLRYFQWNSRIVRKMLSLYFKEGRSYKIPFGPLSGKYIHYRSDITFHTMLGLWELEHISILTKVLKSSLFPNLSVFCDVGANVGIYSLWLSSLTKDQGTIYAFEPGPMAVNVLRQNIAINQLENIEVIEKACSDKVGFVDFFLGKDHHSSSLDCEWATGPLEQVDKITVESITLDDFFLNVERPLPDFVKMDIEGGAMFALPGCKRLIEHKRVLIFVESHTPDEDRAIGHFMLEHRYEGYRLNNHQWIANPKQTHPNPEGVWGSILLCPEELKSQINQLIPNC